MKVDAREMSWKTSALWHISAVAITIVGIMNIATYLIRTTIYFFTANNWTVKQRLSCLLQLITFHKNL